MARNYDKEFKDYMKQSRGLLNKLRVKYINSEKSLETKEDLEQELQVAVYQAIKKYKPELKYSKNTFIIPLVAHALAARKAENYGTLVRIPRNFGRIRNKIMKVLDIKNELQDTDKEEIKKAYKCSDKVIDFARNNLEFHCFQTVGITRVSEKHNGQDEEYIGKDNREALDTFIDRNYTKRKLLKILRETRLQNQSLVIMRYGLSGGPAMSIRDIAEKTNRPEKSVRALITQVINKMKIVYNRKYKEYDKIVEE